MAKPDYPKMIVDAIPYGRQQVTDEDVAAVAAALRDPFLTQGPAIERFEREFAAAVGASHAIAVNSGTAALHAAYAAAGVGPESTVITSPITFVATANAARYLGARVRFADVDPQTGLIDPDAVRKIDAPAGSVLAPVHLTGQAADMPSLAAVARERGWVVVEDAAHALGATVHGDGPLSSCVGDGRYADLTCFSFHPVKHITTGEGGAVTTNDPSLRARLARFRTHGITRNPLELERNEGPWWYEQHDLGFNYRLTDFQCVLGSRQLARLADFVATRRAIAAAYDADFSVDDGIRPVPRVPWSTSSHHLYVVHVEPRQRRRVFEALREDGIGVNVHYIPVPEQPYYRSLGYSMAELPGASAYYSGAISLPIYVGLREDERSRVVASLRKHVGT